MSGTARPRLTGKVAIEEQTGPHFRPGDELHPGEPAEHKQRGQKCKGDWHQAKEPPNIKTPQIDRAFQQLGCDQKSTQHKKNRHTMLAGLGPWGRVAARLSNENVIHQNQRDRNSAPSVEYRIADATSIFNAVYTCRHRVIGRGQTYGCKLP